MGQGTIDQVGEDLLDRGRAESSTDTHSMTPASGEWRLPTWLVKNLVMKPLTTKPRGTHWCPVCVRDPAGYGRQARRNRYLA